MTEEQVTFLKRVAFECAKTFQLFNLSKTDAIVYAYLYMENKPLSVDDLSEALGQSKTSIHTSVRHLMNFNLIHKAWVKGSRRHYFKVYENIFKQFQHVIEKQWVETIDRQLTTLKEEVNDAATNQYNDQIKKLIEFHEVFKQSSNNLFNKKLHEE